MYSNHPPMQYNSLAARFLHGHYPRGTKPVESRSSVTLFDSSNSEVKRIGNAIMMPPDIEMDTFGSFYASLYDIRKDYDGVVDIFISGRGGDTDATFSIISVVQRDGQVRGVLTGDAVSAHSVMWAGCPYRITMLHAGIGVHPTWAGHNSNVREIKHIDQTLKRRDELVQQVYSEASNKKPGFWNNVMWHNKGEMVYIPSNALVHDLEMAEWW